MPFRSRPRARRVLEERRERRVPAGSSTWRSARERPTRPPPPLDNGVAADSFVVLAAVAAAIVVTILVQRGPSYYRVGEDNVESPQVVSSTRPQYTAEAMQAHLQGRVGLECVVQTDGLCTDLRVVDSLDPAGLDEQALAALRQWRFEPGRRNGDPVPVLVNFEFTFTLR